MVASEDGDAVLKAHFERNQEGKRLDRVVASVHVVAHEQVVRVRGLSTNFKQFAQVMELPVDVAANSHRRLYLLHIRLVNKDLFCFFAESFDLALWKRLAGEEGVDLFVK